MTFRCGDQPRSIDRDDAAHRLANAEAEARFKLEVESKGVGGTTRTVQSGINRKGGAGGVLLSSQIRTSGLSHWTARLRVHADGQEYNETRSSAG